ncbi:MAG: hypothetical protein AAFO84_11210 [Cyanobacteria bacterium J06598_1]
MKPFLTPDISSICFGTKSLVRVAAASLFGSLPLGMTLLVSSASANADFFECTTGMVAAGIAEDSASAACASSRVPNELGACVVDVSEFTGLAAPSALLMCERSRRPTEVANCTINIHDAFLESPSNKVLENCGRSLLPDRYSVCVVDIVEATEVAVDNALDQCIRAGYRPWRIEPRL